MIQKYVARNSPYIEETFGSLVDGLYGSSRMLSGGAVTVVTATTIAVAPYVFMQSGLVVVNPDGHGTVVVPNFSTEKRPVYLIVSSPDITTESGVVITATPALYALTGVVVAVRTNDVWVNSPASSVTASDDAIRLVEKGLGTGVIYGLDPRILITGADTATGVGVRIGQALDSQGVKNLTTGVAAGAAADEHVELSSGQQDEFWPKSNYYMLRAPAGVIRAGGPSLAILPDDTPVRVGVSVDTSTVCTTLVVRQTDGYTGVIWTKGSTLKYSTYDAIENQVLAPVTLYTSTGTFDGFRDLAADIRSDGAVVISFCDSVGGQRVLKILSIHFDDGVAVTDDAGVKTISALANQVRAPRFVLDQTDTMHAVAMHNEGAPNNQVYYFRVTAAAGAAFGSLLSGTPRIVPGANDGGNDTHPSIAIDAFRNLTIAYAKGTGSNNFGNVIVALLDPGGNLLSTTVVSTSAITASGGVATGYDTPATLAQAAYPRAVTTPQGDSYVMFAASTAANLQNIYLYSPTFAGRFGAKCIDLFRTNAADIGFLEFFADELGTLRAQSVVTTAGAAIQTFRLDTIVAPQSVLAPSVLDDFTSVSGNRFACKLAPGGSNRFTVFDSGATTLFTGTSAGAKNGFFTVHPHDSLLGAWSLEPRFGLGTPQQSVATIRPQRIRPARYSNPVQVGRDGDFVGFDSLSTAIETSLGSGLVVRLMPGLHEMSPWPLNSYGALELEGCPGAVVAVNSSNTTPMTFAGRGAVSVTSNPSAGVFDITGSAPVYPGDVLSFLNGAGDPVCCHIVEVESATRVRVFPDISHSTPASANVLSSIRMRGLRLLGATFGAATINILSSWDPRIEDNTFENIQLNIISVESGAIYGNRLNGNTLLLQNANRTAVVRNESMNCGTDQGAGMQFNSCSRLRVADNRSTDHGNGTYGYSTEDTRDFFAWGNNEGTVNTDDPGRLISNNQVVTAVELFATDIRVERLNGGSFDARIAALAGEIDALKPQPVISGNYLRTFTFSDNSALFF